MKYEKPKLIDICAAHGDPQNCWSGFSDLTGSCEYGSQASGGSCATGNDAGGSCFNGFAASG